MTMELSFTQQQILNHAAAHTGDKLSWFPDNIKGGVRKKVIDSLFSRGFITANKTDLASL